MILLSNIKLRSLVCMVTLCCVSPTTIAQEVLYIGTGGSPFTKQTYIPLYQDFEQLTGIKIVRILVDDLKLLDNEQAWYTHNNVPIDIIHGQASRRLEKYYREGKIQPINEFWDKNNLDKNFAHLKPLITFNKQILALPYSVYGWQMFYLKSQLGENFVPPKSIDELAELCLKISAQGIVPFHITSKSEWNQMVWFEYIILRTYGLNYFNELMNGKHSFNSIEVETVLKTWKNLITSQCFSEKYGTMDWKELLPFFLRKKVGLMFAGNTLNAYLKTPERKADIGFFAFPKIADIPRFETAPTNAIIVSKLSNKPAAVEKFLTFIAQAKMQENITHTRGSIPANSQSSIPTEPHANKLSAIVLEAAGHSAFIDRILLPEFETASRPYFMEFIKSGDITIFMAQLEALRLKYYPPEQPEL